MEQKQTAEEVPATRDILISYTGHDTSWAEWIGSQIEQAGYSVFLLAWDGQPGHNLILALDQALRACQRCLLVLSPAYLQDGLAQAQWATVFQQDPANEHRTLLPVMVENCQPGGLLMTHTAIDLSGLNEVEASERLLAFLAAEQLQPGQQIPQQKPSQRSSYPSAPVTWNLPYRRNPFFTGQEEYLRELRRRLWENQAVSVNQAEAISGLGGIGKTQLAVEYAYRHRADYTHVFWVLAESPDTCIRSFVEIADLLQLPERMEQDQNRIVAAVQRWLQNHHRYLLILDNADAPELLAEYLPSAPTGHLLVTTRSARLSEYGLGLSSPLAMTSLAPKQGAQLLLRRAGLIAAAAEDDRRLAMQLSEDLGGLPLALDQAGAYIASTGTGLAAYCDLYRQRHLDILRERYNFKDHPAPVVTTWAISFERVEKENPVAVDLLRYCAFLAPEAIPEEIFGAEVTMPASPLTSVAADGYAFDQAIRALRAYSLIERDPESRTLTMHRLVQEVVRTALPEEEQHRWMQQVVQGINAVVPPLEIKTWPIYERLLSHALLCSRWIDQAVLFSSESAHLLNQTALYLDRHARYPEAEALLRQVLEICERALGGEHPGTAQSLNNLAYLYYTQGNYEAAIPLYERALEVREQVLGGEHPDTAQSLNNLASLYDTQGNYEAAALLYQRALAIRERMLGGEHPDTASSLNNLAALYDTQGNYEEATPLYQRALAIYERALGEEHPDTAQSLNNLAALYQKQGKYEEAAPLYQRALAIRERVLGGEHPDTAQSLNNLATLYHMQGNYEEAALLYERALAIYERALGEEHPDTASSLNNLAYLYCQQEIYEEAALLYERALAIQERVLGAEHPDTALSLNNLAYLSYIQGNYEEAAPLYQRALEMRERVLGAEHPDTAQSLNNLAALYRAQGNYEEAVPLYQRALKIRERVLGEEHPDTAQSLNNLAALYGAQGYYEEAAPLYQRALEICEHVLGAAHPNTRIIQSNYQTLLDEMRE